MERRGPVLLPPIGRRAALAALGTVALVLLVAAPASAHVKVAPDQAAPGADDVQLTFAVPNESASATTTRVEIDLPTATPFGDVAFVRVPGWTGSVTSGALPKPVEVNGATVRSAPLKVVWTADAGTRLTPGEVQDFVISVGPVPDTGRILLPAVQTYSDGSVVRWDQPTPDSGEEPEHPAPTIFVRDSPPDGSASADAASPGTTLAVVLGGTGLAVALLSAVLAGLAFLRAGRPTR
jgi:uncharacterized protein YcnI